MTGQENETVQTVDSETTPAQENEATAPAAEQTSDVTNDATAENQQQSDDVENLRSQLEQQQAEANANKDLALRAQAEMENLRKRTSRDIENAHKYALEKFVNELLPIMDSMELGMSAADNTENSKELKEGMELTLKMFMTALEKFGVKQISPEGEKFNPELHEAVSMQEVDGKEAGSVVSVMQKGYELNGRLVRPAMVMVAK